MWRMVQKLTRPPPRAIVGYANMKSLNLATLQQLSQADSSQKMSKAAKSGPMERGISAARHLGALTSVHT
jgi:hypothetical protein